MRPRVAFFFTKFFVRLGNLYACVQLPSGSTRFALSAGNCSPFGALNSSQIDKRARGCMRTALRARCYDCVFQDAGRRMGKDDIGAGQEALPHLHLSQSSDQPDQSFAFY